MGLFGFDRKQQPGQKRDAVLVRPGLRQAMRQGKLGELYANTDTPGAVP